MSVTRRELLRWSGEWVAASCVAGTIGNLISASPARGQDAQEQLGAAEGPVLAGAHPLAAIEAAHPGALRPELAGVHPRVFFTDNDIESLRRRSRTTHADLWKRALQTMIALHEEPAPPPAEARRAQNDVGLAIAEAAFAYKIEQDPKYLQIALKFMDAAVSYDIWGYKTDKPNIDLAAGHLLYGLGWGYDLLYHDLTDAQREMYRSKLAKQGKMLFDSYALTSKKQFSYSQNHLFIPAAGLGIAAYALYGEVPEASDWARRVRALYDRVLATYGTDGYYYEGFEYWVFATPWIVHYLDVLAHVTGEDLYDQPGLRNAYKYVSQSILPDGKNVFDFGDVFDGPLTRSGKSPEIERTHPGGHLHSNFNLLYRFAQRFRSGEAQGVAQWLASLSQTSFEDYWALVWYDPDVAPIPIDHQPTMQYFPDHEVVYWRSGWDAAATAFAFKCGPPEGHHAAEVIAKFPDWHLEDGHAHPDAGSFILFAEGQYLTGVTGYAGVPMSNQVNTLLTDGHGQAREGGGHDAFRNIPYDRLNRIRILKVTNDSGLTVTADATAAYDPALGVKSLIRTIHLENNRLTISDSVQTESPRTPSILFHFDGDAQPAQLRIDVEEPPDATKKLEPNMMTGPGAPGSVDKGTRQQRGTRLVISTPGPVSATNFKTVLQW